MKQEAFQRQFGYEITMTDLWQCCAAGKTSWFELFRVQAEQGMEDSMPRGLLAGRIEKGSLAAGFHQGNLMIQVDLPGLQKKQEQFRAEFNAKQAAALRQVLSAWKAVPSRRGRSVQVCPNHDLHWLPAPEEAVSQGIIGLYQRSQEGDESSGRYREYIDLMNRMIDRYKYYVCASIVTEPDHPIAKKSYSSLARIKYLPPRSLMETLQLLLLHCQVFRPSSLSNFGRVLCAALAYDRKEAQESEEFQASLLSAFLSKYSFCVHSFGQTAQIRLQGEAKKEAQTLLPELFGAETASGEDLFSLRLM